MPRSLLPPRGIFASTRLVFDRDLSAPAKETLLQLMALSWASDSHITPVLTYPLLEHLTGKNARTLRGHLAALRNAQAVLRSQPAGPGQFMLVLAGWLFTSAGDNPAPAPRGKLLPAPVKEEQEELIPPASETILPPLNQSGRKAAGGKKAPAPPARQPRLSQALEASLRDAGVFPALLAEVAALAAEYGLKEKDLLALLDWCAADQPGRPASLFVGRLRAGGRAPQAYYTPPCRRCGQRGGHSAECPQRYALPPALDLPDDD